MLSKIKSALKTDKSTSQPASQSTSSSAPASNLTEANSQAQTSTAPALESQAATTMSAKIAIVYCAPSAYRCPLG